MKSCMTFEEYFSFSLPGSSSRNNLTPPSLRLFDETGMVCRGRFVIYCALWAYDTRLMFLKPLLLIDLKRSLILELTRASFSSIVDTGVDMGKPVANFLSSLSKVDR